MPKLQLVSEETLKIEFDEGAWVEVRKELPFSVLAEMHEKVNSGGQASQIDATLELLSKAVVAWSLPVAPSKDIFLKLNAQTIEHLAQKCAELYNPEKKSLQS